MYFANEPSCPLHRYPSMLVSRGTNSILIGHICCHDAVCCNLRSQRQPFITSLGIGIHSVRRQSYASTQIHWFLGLIKQRLAICIFGFLKNVSPEVWRVLHKLIMVADECTVHLLVRITLKKHRWLPGFASIYKIINHSGNCLFNL